MRIRPVPRLATWLLQLFCSRAEHDSMIGDLMERYQQGSGRFWYWRQVLAIVGVEFSRRLSQSHGYPRLPLTHGFVLILLIVGLFALLLSDFWVFGAGVFGGIIVGSLLFLLNNRNGRRALPHDRYGPARIDSSRIPISGGIGAGVLILGLLTALLLDLRELRLLAAPGLLAGLIFAAILRLWRRFHPQEIGRDWISIKPK